MDLLVRVPILVCTPFWLVGQSGLGDAAVGQGVAGLGRALQLAGAESIVMSLWSIDDDSTAVRAPGSVHSNHRKAGPLLLDSRGT